MSGFLYYLPDVNRQTAETRIHEVGLAYALGDGFTPCEVTKGPDGQAGLVLAPRSFEPDNAIRFYPDRQLWRQIPKSKAWAGFYRQTLGNVVRPKPQELFRPEPLGGHFVRLGDGNDWLIPVARGSTDQDGDLRWYNALPTVTALDDQGQWTFGSIDEQHQRLWGIATKWWDQWVNADLTEGDTTERSADVASLRFDFVGINDAALAAISTNYRIAKIEVAMLGLFNQANVARILCALVDWPTVQEFLKKKALKDESASAGSSSAAGLPDTPRDTVQP